MGMETQVWTYVAYWEMFRVEKFFLVRSRRRQSWTAGKYRSFEILIFFSFKLKFRPQYQTTCLKMTKYQIDIVLSFHLQKN